MLELHNQVTSSVIEGAVVLTGGERIPGEGSFYPPTVLSQVKKGIEFRKAKKPTVSDIEWSGLIKQLSSYIFFSYYPGKYYGFDVLGPDYYYLIAEKTRFAEQFTYPMKVHPEYGYFEEIESADERQKRVNELRNIVD